LGGELPAFLLVNQHHVGGWHCRRQGDGFCFASMQLKQQQLQDDESLTAAGLIHCSRIVVWMSPKACGSGWAESSRTTA
jgi:hypothetical protein